MAGLELRAITKSFDKVEVLHGIDLSVRDGEFVVFVGPSGCGKSTLLRMIAPLHVLAFVIGWNSKVLTGFKSF